MWRSQKLRLDMIDDDIVEERKERYYLRINGSLLPDHVSLTTNQYRYPYPSSTIIIFDDDCKCNHR